MRSRFTLMAVLASLVLPMVGCGSSSSDNKAASSDNAARTCATGQFAAVRRYEGVVDPAEAGKRVAEGFLPIISKIDGFVAYYWIDAGNHVMVSTSVFKDRAGAEASTAAAKDYVAKNLAQLLPNKPQVTEGEVVATKC